MIICAADGFFSRHGSMCLTPTAYCLMCITVFYHKLTYPGHPGHPGTLSFVFAHFINTLLFTIKHVFFFMYIYRFNQFLPFTRVTFIILLCVCVCFCCWYTCSIRWCATSPRRHPHRRRTCRNCRHRRPDTGPRRTTCRWISTSVSISPLRRPTNNSKRNCFSGSSPWPAQLQTRRLDINRTRRDRCSRRTSRICSRRRRTINNSRPSRLPQPLAAIAGCRSPRRTVRRLSPIDPRPVTARPTMASSNRCPTIISCMSRSWWTGPRRRRPHRILCRPYNCRRRHPANKSRCLKWPAAAQPNPAVAAEVARRPRPW